MALSCIVCEIERVIVENHEICIPHLCLAPPQGGGTPPSELANTFDTHKTMIGLPCGEEIDNMLSFLIQYRNVTDRRTDRHNSYISISIAVLTHDKNGKTHICRHETVLVEGQ